MCHSQDPEWSNKLKNKQGSSGGCPCLHNEVYTLVEPTSPSRNQCLFTCSTLHTGSSSWWKCLWGHWVISPTWTSAPGPPGGGPQISLPHCAPFCPHPDSPRLTWHLLWARRVPCTTVPKPKPVFRKPLLAGWGVSESVN